jgi:hypothetical protein
MGTYKLLLDDDLGYDFSLIAIHTSLEAYHIAYLLNKNLKLKLSRTKEDLVLRKDKYTADFPLFEYEDLQKYATYYFFYNKAKTTIEQDSQGLFDNQRGIVVSDLFISDLPKVDYLLKIYDDGCAFAKAKTLKEINSIPQIVTAYSVAIDQLKTKQNLIFE